MLDDRFWRYNSRWIGNDDDGGFGIQKEAFEKLWPVAEALLIAVESIEKIEKGIDMEAYDETAAKAEASEALSRIRSLPSHG